nr:MAG: putative major capsid protein [Lake Baikal virophage 11]
MSADIAKMAVYDDRIVQQRPAFAVDKGALSLTNTPVSAISQSASQHTYNYYAPSENIFVGRDINWSSTVNLELKVRLNNSAAGGQFPINQALFQPGVDGSLAAFPLNSLCATMTATINDTTVTINSQDVLTEVLRLTDYKPNRLERTCPTMMDKYQQNYYASGAQNDPISGYTNASHDFEQPNGAWNNIIFTTPTGTPLVGSQQPAYTCANGFIVNTIDGVPVSTDQGLGVVNGLYSVFLRWRTTEKLCLSPFIFSEEHSQETGLFGINNIQMQMNMRDPNRCMRLRDAYVGTTEKLFYGGGASPSTWLPPLSYNAFISAGPFQDSVLNVQSFTPALDLDLPPKSVVPYMEFPRFISQPLTSAMAAGDVQTLASQTITLPQIPDLLIIYVKALADPSSTAVDKSLDPTLPQYGASYLPIECSLNGTRTVAPFSLNFDNFSGLLSSATSEQLYHMSIKNGLNMDWNTWSGLAKVSNGAVGSSVASVGGFLVLKPGVDVTLQSGQASSLVGNFTLQFSIRVRNTFDFPVQPQIFVITANSGFLESIRGSSRIIKGVLSEEDIISAPIASVGTSSSLARVVGGNMMKLATRLGLAGNSSRSMGAAAAPSAQKGAGKPMHSSRSLSQRLM